VFDLTQVLAPDIPRFPGDPQVQVAPLPGYAPWQVSAIACGTHSGTHMDAPRHRFADGKGIGAYSADRFVGEGLVVEADGLGENEPIPASVLDAVSEIAWPGWFALIRTGWSRYWQDDRYFRHPYLSPALADRLALLGAGIVAIDALRVDSTVDGGSTTHERLLSADVLIAENLRGLDALTPGTLFAVACLPLSLGDTDGSPARIVAWNPSRLGR
jgi:kynurenine formamidase